MITKTARQQIKHILVSPQWQTIERLATLFTDNIMYESVLRDNEWETIKTALMNEGQVQGIKRFIQELYKEAQNVEN